MTSERIEHGRYLAYQVMGCVGCHAKKDCSKFSGPIIKETTGRGGEVLNEKKGFPDEFNTEMPWEYYAQLSEENLEALFDYLQSISPIRNSVIKSTRP